jgi:WD40 repeat protein
MKARFLYQILYAGTLAIAVLSSGCGAPAASAPDAMPTSAQIEATPTLRPTVVPSVTPEPTQISFPFGIGTALPALTEKITPENAANIIEVARWDLGGVRTFTFAPDGQHLLVGMTNGNLMLVGISNGELVQTLEGHTKSVSSMAYSSDGQFIVSGSIDKAVRVWNAADGSVLHVLEGHEDAVTSVAISADGQTIASGSTDNTIRLWNFTDGKLLKTIKSDFIGATSLSFSADGSTLASGGADDTARVWDVVSGAQLQKFTYKPITPGETYSVQVDYSPDGTLLAGRHSYTGMLTLYNARDFSEVVTMPIPGLKNSDFVFSPDGQMIIAGAKDSGLNFVNSQDGTPLKRIELGNIKSVAISPDGALVAVMGDDYFVHVWGLTT